MQATHLGGRGGMKHFGLQFLVAVNMALPDSLVYSLGNRVLFKTKNKKSLSLPWFVTFIFDIIAFQLCKGA